MTSNKLWRQKGSCIKNPQSSYELNILTHVDLDLISVVVI